MISIEGNIVTNEGEVRRRIEIDDSGVIANVSEATGSANYIFSDELIFPGFIDLHVHAREDASHSQDYKEDFGTAGAAAISGGVVAFAEMPNNPVPPADDKSYEAKSELTKKSPVPVLLYAALGPNTKPLSKKVPYKVFMGKSVGDMYFTSREDLEKVLEGYRGAQVSFHCEDPKILDAHQSAPTHEEKRPVEAEFSAVETAIALTQMYGLHTKICHASTIESVEKVVAAKSRGLDITIEVAPHHLYFDGSMLTGEMHTALQVNPPIRQTRENRLALIQALREGKIDYLATDHAPHTLEEKEKGMSGMPHLDTYGDFTSWLMKEHGYTPKDVARIASENPGEFLNQFMSERYGKIQEGYVGSLTVIDMKKPHSVTRESVKTKCGWPPFEGMEFPGSVKMTIAKGKIYAK